MTKPQHLRVVEGNTGKRPEKKSQKPRPARIHPPTYLCAEARAQWRRLLPILESRGANLGAEDRDLLSTFCDALVTYRATDRQLRAEGFTLTNSRGDHRKHPAWQIHREAHSIMVTVGRHFGLSPLAREALPAGEEPTDDWDADI